MKNLIRLMYLMMIMKMTTILTSKAIKILGDGKLVAQCTQVTQRDRNTEGIFIEEPQTRNSS